MHVRDLPSPNHDTRPAGTSVDMLVIHYTGMADAQSALDRLTDPAAKVSAHYLIDEDGTVTRLVEEARRAWHAGVASWRGATDINARSVGIELVNPGHEYGYRPFPEPQMESCEWLCRDLVGRHPIPARNVVGHADVAPTRKMDPGERFDWPRLARAGIGLWPEESEHFDRSADAVWAMLADVGYDIANPIAALRAFQRHFRPERVTGRIDWGTARRLAGLAALCR